MERKLNENQYGASVPTEYEAISNMTRRPETQVVRYDKPSIEDRQRAADIFNESVSANMSEQEALEMVRLTVGIDGDWLKKVPEWARAVAERNAKKTEEQKDMKRIRYSKAVKRKAVNLFLQYRNDKTNDKEATRLVNKELGTNIQTNTIIAWLPTAIKKTRGDQRETRYGHTNDERIRATKKYIEYRKTMKAVDAWKRMCEEENIAISQATMWYWVQQYSEEIASKERRTCAECGKEVPADYKFCPYCGKALETQKEKMLRLCDELIQASSDKANVAKIQEIASYIQCA